MKVDAKKALWKLFLAYVNLVLKSRKDVPNVIKKKIIYIMILISKRMEGFIVTLVIKAMLKVIMELVLNALIYSTNAKNVKKMEVPLDINAQNVLTFLP